MVVYRYISWRPDKRPHRLSGISWWAFPRLLRGWHFWNLAIIHIFCYELRRIVFMSTSVRVFSPSFSLLYQTITPRIIATSNMNVHPKGKKLAILFFSSSKRKKNRWVRDESGTSVLQRMSLYTDLRRHITKMHSDGIVELENASLKRTKEPFHVMMHPALAVSAYERIEWVTHCFVPFEFVENRVIRHIFRHNSILVYTLSSYLDHLTSKMEDKINSTLSDKFAIIFDGSTGGNNHYVSVFATYPSNQSTVYGSVLLALTSIGDQNASEANKHYELMQIVLQVLEKSIENVADIVRDSCNAIRAFTRCIGPLFLRCQSRRYQLGLKDTLQAHMSTTERVRKIMRKLSVWASAAKLRCLTPLCPKLDTETK